MFDSQYIKRPPMQKTKNTIPATIFLGLTIGLTTILGYNTYIWINISDLYRNLDKNTTIDNVEIITKNDTNLTVNINITITNPYTCTHIDTYIAIKAIKINEKFISLEDYYHGQLPGTFIAGFYIPPGSKATASFNFDISQSSLNMQENQNITLYIRLLAATIINQGKPQTVEFTKQYRTQQT
jgi:hypothetical protein